MSHVPCVCVCGSVTNNNTWARIGYRIYSLWRSTAAADYNYNKHLALVAPWAPTDGTALRRRVPHLFRCGRVTHLFRCRRVTNYLPASN
jgi:hypothetical protein